MVLQLRKHNNHTKSRAHQLVRQANKLLHWVDRAPSACSSHGGATPPPARRGGTSIKGSWPGGSGGSLSAELLAFALVFGSVGAVFLGVVWLCLYTRPDSVTPSG